ncbi:UPF0182 family protein [Clostridium sp. YIM B02506]|uniref:UPF0182 family protein n=1 Tax=Clostridium sp. YIM B02506 TaxID=2910680 RepID=UPI001EEDEDEC|nr:UPF0182 family protein [Clostridium sp. YIM B02506]
MKKKQFLILIGILFMILALIISSTKIIIDIEWFQEVGYIKVYLTKMLAVLKLMGPLFLSCFVLIYLLSKSILISIEKEFKSESLFKLRKAVLVFNIIISFIISINASMKYWYNILLFTNSNLFNYKDPIFNIDASFYIFKLPLIDIIYNFFKDILFIALIITIGIYVFISLKKYAINKNYMKFSQHLKEFKEILGKQAATLVSMLIFLIGIGYILKSFYILYSNNGGSFGASFTDINITLNFYKVIIIVSIISSIIAFIMLRRNKFKPLIFFTGIILFLIIIQPLIYNIVYKFFVKPNEIEYESPYISYNIDATNEGFNINNIEEKDFDPGMDLNSTKIKNNKQIISNLKVNSPGPVLNFYNQVQEIRSYYKFLDIDTDRYIIDGKYTQVFLAPREIETSAIDNWQSNHMVYTHGYGVVMSKVNKVTDEGQPDFLMKNLPTENLTNIYLKNPRIYFGEVTNDYAIVNTSSGELDYPKENGDTNYKYDDKGGIKLSLFNRILFSLREQNFKILFSGNITNESKILINRNILERVKKIAPFLEYDEDPYMVINEGKLYWVIDGYTTANKFPYSQPYGGINYIRNSFKVVIDASSGETNYYIVDEKDPIVLGYSKIFRGLFKNKEEIPSGLQSHFKYPKKIFDIQSNVLSTYHIKDPKEFFTLEDVWEVSSNSSDAKESLNNNEGLYLVTQLPGEKNEEMVLFNYFNMKSKKNMISMLGARMDGENYGKLVLFKFSPEKTIYGPYLFRNQILQDPYISQEISLWEGKGSKVEYGETVILPIENSLIYMLPIYLKADVEKTIPEMKRIILSDGKKIVMEENLNKALESLFNYKEKIINENTINEEQRETSIEIQDLYNKAIESQTKGNWAEYGEYIKKLGEAIEKLNK